MRLFLRWFPLLAILSLFSLSGCISTCASNLGQMGKVRDVADKAVSHFHQQLDAGEYEAIYQEADPEFQKASAHDDTIQFLAAVHRKLGNVAQVSQRNYVVNWRTNGTFASINYETQFAGGKGTEAFTWRVEGDKARLVGYNINSQALIVK